MQSKFTGSLLGLIGINILTGILISVTFGIATPWAICMKQDWITRHTIIDGKQLYFDGTGGELIGKYIIWWLLTLVTCGIYGFWLSLKMEDWVVSHTHIR